MSVCLSVCLSVLQQPVTATAVRDYAVAATTNVLKGLEILTFHLHCKKLTRKLHSERELFYDDIFNHSYAVCPRIGKLLNSVAR